MKQSLLRSLRGKISFFESLLAREKSRKSIKQIQNKNATSFEVFYDHSDSNPLAVLCDYYGSDKGGLLSNELNFVSFHNYTDFYHLLFGSMREHVKNVFECGIGTNNPQLKSSMGLKGKPGASLRVWRDYFPNAKIYGVDIDKEIIFQEDRIVTFYCDQTSKESIVRFLENASLAPGSLQIIIDDGLHEYQAGISLFQEMKEYISSDGFYIIEDVRKSDKLKYINYFNKFRKQFDCYIVNLHRNSAKLGDNSLIVLRPRLGFE